MGVGGAANAPDFLQDYFSQAFAYDGGSSSSSGARVAYQQKLSDDLDTLLVYAYGGALAPEGVSAGRSHALPALDRSPAQCGGPRFYNSYLPWARGSPPATNGSAVQSSHNRILTDNPTDHIAPYLSVQIHQPLPAFFFAGHMQIEADAGNLLAQGYVPLSTSRGKVILVPSCRYFRGGLSFQF